MASDPRNQQERLADWEVEWRRKPDRRSVLSGARIEQHATTSNRSDRDVETARVSS